MADWGLYSEGLLSKVNKEKRRLGEGGDPGASFQGASQWSSAGVSVPPGGAVTTCGKYQLGNHSGPRPITAGWPHGLPLSDSRPQKDRCSA